MFPPPGDGAGRASVLGAGGSTTSAREGRALEREVLLGLEVGEDQVVVLLALGLVELERVELVDAVDDEAGVLTGPVRDLEVPDEGPGDRAQPGGRVEDVLEIAEPVTLLGLVVDRAVRRG